MLRKILYSTTSNIDGNVNSFKYLTVNYDIFYFKNSPVTSQNPIMQ